MKKEMKIKEIIIIPLFPPFEKGGQGGFILEC